MKTDDPPLRIGIVGPCTAGKSTLIQLLNANGIQARHIAQEHSYVQNMWLRMTNPDVLVFLDVSYPVSMLRRKINWNLDEYMEQQRRLAHARANAHLYLMTDQMAPQDVLRAVLDFIAAKKKV